jgi:hypothetical protein
VDSTELAGARFLLCLADARGRRRALHCQRTRRLPHHACRGTLQKYDAENQVRHMYMNYNDIFVGLIFAKYNFAEIVIVSAVLISNERE